jgi:hypothetical protein
MTQAQKSVAEWLDSCEKRFRNMFDAKLDENGYPAIQKALKNFNEKGYFTIGEIQYLFNRSHPQGALPKYNRHQGYDKKYGDMIQCPIKDLVDSNLVNWRTGKPQQPFADAIRAETRWEYKMGNLRPQSSTAFSDLFGG